MICFGVLASRFDLFFLFQLPEVSDDNNYPPQKLENIGKAFEFNLVGEHNTRFYVNL